MINNSGNKFSYYIKLSKLKILLPVSLTGLTGYFVFDPHFTIRLLMVTLGILIVAISASVLNQIQESDLDSKMNRTLHRPIPSGKISKTEAVIFFLANFIAGTTLLYTAGNFQAAVIGLVTIFWYNVIYTYLKRKTVFAVLPGAISGALPPLIGYVAAGGGLWDRQIVFLEFLFFTGQIPHFWLLMLKYGEDYKQAGIPSLSELLGDSQISRLTFTWIVFSIVGALFMCYFEIIQSNIMAGVLLTASVIVIWQFSDLIRFPGNKKNFKRYFILLNSYFILVLILLISDRLFM